MPQVIPSGSPVSLSLRLPLGSEERLYLITLTSGRRNRVVGIIAGRGEKTVTHFCTLMPTSRTYPQGATNFRFHQTAKSSVCLF